MDELLGKSDIVSLHCPMTKENYHLLDKEAFKKMKDGAIVINTNRTCSTNRQLQLSSLTQRLRLRCPYQSQNDRLKNLSVLLHS